MENGFANTIEKDVYEMQELSESEKVREAEKEQGVFRSVLHEHKIEKIAGETIAKIICSNFYVDKDERIDDLANQLTVQEDILAVGVVNEAREVLGVIVCRDLFNLLGRPYGRDFLKNRTVAKVMKEVPSFHFEANFFSVADVLVEETKSPHVQFYVLKDSHNGFVGIFSTRDLLVYLSELTRKDIALARRLQSSIVKERTLLEESHFDIIASSQMAKGVGGDFYAIDRINDTNWIINVADVSGKGVAASLITAVVGGMFSSYDFNRGMKTFIQTLNTYMIDTFAMEKFITGIFINLNEETGELLICDMGHSYIYIKKPGQIFKLKTSANNLPIGILPDITPEINKYQLEKDDMLILVTDGVIEQTNSESEEYGIIKTEKIIREHEAEGLDSIRETLIKDIHEYRGFEPQHDDITFLFLHYKG